MDSDWSNLMRGLSILVFMGLIGSISAFGQIQPSDSVRVAHPHRNALLHSIGQPISIWALNWYVLDQYWADISVNTLKTNIETGWVWDEDGFDVNQVGHPTQGALVYTAARAQGLGFWESSVYPTLASLIWEVGMENESPSINDMITTPMSGIAFGEIIHRISTLTLGTAKNKPLSRQILTGLINPLGYGFSRIVMGESIHQNYMPTQSNILSDLAFGGGPGYRDDSATTTSAHRRFIRFNIVYGNPFEKARSFKPFDNFNLVTILNLSRKDYVGEIYASGMLSKLFTHHSGRSQIMIGVFHNYDFMNQDDYKVSSSSVGPGLIYMHSLTNKIKLAGHANGSFIFMGSAGDISDDLGVQDYHIGPGFSTKFMGRLLWADQGQAYIRLKRYFINVMEDDHVDGYENINLLTMGVQVKHSRNYGLGVEYLASARTVSYLDVDRKDTLQTSSLYRIYLSYYIIDNIFN